MNKSLQTTFFILSCFFSLMVLADQQEAVKVGSVTTIAATDAHEGPVYVASQNRLYFTTKRGVLKGVPNVSIKYLDLNTFKVSTFIKNANMANGMFLANDGKHLLVAEQGNMKTNTLGGISRIDITTGQREMLVDSYQGKPFNSPNKVVQGKNGLIYFSDPSYGYNQGFKPAPALANGIYVFNPKTHKISALSVQFVMPLGLTLINDDSVLIVGDTGAIDGKNPYDASRTHDLYQVNLNGPGKVDSVIHLMTISPGIPDGFVVVGAYLYVATGDGVGQYTQDGELVKKYPIIGGAVNLTVAGDALLVTADRAIYKIK